MEKILKKFRQDLILSSVAFIILGILIFFFSEHVSDFAGYITGAFLISFGVRRIIEYIKQYSTYGSNIFSLTVGVILLFVGIFIVITPKILENFIFALLGSVIIVNGIINLLQAVEIKQSGSPDFSILMIISILVICVGIFVVFNSGAVSDAIIKIVGILFVFIGSSILWAALYVKKKYKVLNSYEIEIESMKAEDKND